MAELTLPNLLLAGVPKAGTTSLHAFLLQHPDICGSLEKELDYFTPLRVQGTALPPIEDYASHFEICRGARYRIDGSPSYAIGGPPVISAVRAALGRPRVILLLRDPTRRLWSAYTFAKGQGHLSDIADFDDFVSRCEAARREGVDRALGNRLMALSTGFYDEYLGPWLEEFGGDLRVVFAEDLAARPKSVLEELFVWLGVDPHGVGQLDLSARNRTVYARNQWLARAVYGSRVHGERLFVRAPAVRRLLRRAYGLVNTREVDEVMQPSTERRLAEIYGGSLRRTAALLKTHGYDRLPAWLATGEGQSGAPGLQRG